MDRDTMQSLVTRPWTGKPDAGQGEGRLAWQADGDERRDLLLSHPSSGEEEEKKMSFSNNRKSLSTSGLLVLFSLYQGLVVDRRRH